MGRAILLIFLLYTCVTFLGCAASARKGTAASGKETGIDSTVAAQDTLTPKQKTEAFDSRSKEFSDTSLSPAAEIMVRACNNYIEVDPQNPKVPEVMNLKASVFYNNKLYTQSRKVYNDIFEKYPKTPEAVEAVRMVAQSYYAEGAFDMAQSWYRKLEDVAVGEGNKKEAVARIAESIFMMAEMHEKEQRYTDAATQYERVALEFPDAVIADVALFNAGLAYEKQTEWARAILMFQRLKQRYRNSKLVPKSIFRTAKSYEKLNQWDDAAQTYLRLVANHPRSELTPASLYNAGFCFENAEKFVEAAATFEKHAMSFPNSKDAPDILFKAGEMYGKLKDWQGVTRVNKEFSRRYGHDKNRIVQAQCMVGVALYMQDNLTEALHQLKKAVETYEALNSPSTVNKFYAAKAQYTIGEIYHGSQNKVILTQPKNVYRRKLKEKSLFLDKTVDAYSHVIKYGISDWTTRAIYQVGQAYEDFAYGIFKQERPKNLRLEKSLALEMGIAKAVEEYFIDNALSFYEQNIKLGIKEKIENKHILNSKKKLTYLPCAAGQNYLALVTIAQKLEGKKNLEGFALIAHKLQILQKMAPFQERAIGLFLKSLEMGAMYQEFDEFYKKASSLITKTSFTVAETYAEVADIARSAPIPKDFDDYEKFVYKTKLLKQIEGYEENALQNYLKAVKIAQAYEISDAYVEKTRNAIPKLLFNRGRCYDLLCISAFENPPYPADINEAEKEEYRAQFEEIGLTYQEQAFEIYQTVLDYAEQKYATGDYVNHAYVRLFQNYPDDFGYKQERIETKAIASGAKWKCSADSFDNWYSLEYNDQEWYKVSKEAIPAAITLTGFPDKPPPGMWYENADQSLPSPRAFFRRTFYIKEPPHDAKLYLTALDKYIVYVNGVQLQNDSVTVTQWRSAHSWDLKGKMRQGKNVLAVDVTNTNGTNFGLFPYLALTVTTYAYLPKFPNTEEPVDKKIVSEDMWIFPRIKNFSHDK